MLAFETCSYPSLSLYRSPFEDQHLSSSPIYTLLQFPDLAMKCLSHQQPQRKPKSYPKWQRSFNYAQFRPSDISIKVDGHTLIVSALKEIVNPETADYESVQYVRKCLVPESVKLEAMKSWMDDNGILRLEAPLKKVEKRQQLEKKAEAGKESNKFSHEERMEIEPEQLTTTIVPVVVEQSKPEPAAVDVKDSATKEIPEVVVEDVEDE